MRNGISVPGAGFTIRWFYWLAQVVAIGGEATAAGIYAQFWFPQVPLWYFVVAFSLSLIAINASNVKNFGTFEYWFAMIKVAAIVIFIVLGVAGTLLGSWRRTCTGRFQPDGTRWIYAARTERRVAGYAGRDLLVLWC